MRVLCVEVKSNAFFTLYRVYGTAQNSAGDNVITSDRGAMWLLLQRDDNRYAVLLDKIVFAQFIEVPDEADVR